MQARLHEGDGRAYLWLVNSTRAAQAGRLTVRGATTARAGTAHWAADGACFDGAGFTVPPRDALVVEILA